MDIGCPDQVLKLLFFYRVKVLNVAESFDGIRWNDVADVLEDAYRLTNLPLKDHLLGEDDSSLDPQACWNLGCIRVH